MHERKEVISSRVVSSVVPQTIQSPSPDFVFLFCNTTYSRTGESCPVPAMTFPWESYLVKL